MASLFLDSSFMCEAVLFDESAKVLNQLSLPKKSGHVFHKEIYNFLDKEGLSVSELDCLYTIAGPGHYTGLRLGVGFAQALSVFKVPTIDLYHLDLIREVILQDLAFSNSVWLSNAFKQQYFVCEDIKEFRSSSILIDRPEVLKKINHWRDENKKVWGIPSELESEKLLEDLPSISSNSLCSLKDLFKNHSNLIIKALRVLKDENLQRPIMYYRPDKLEFPIK